MKTSEASENLHPVRRTNTAWFLLVISFVIFITETHITQASRRAVLISLPMLPPLLALLPYCSVKYLIIYSFSPCNLWEILGLWRKTNGMWESARQEIQAPDSQTCHGSVTTSVAGSVAFRLSILYYPQSGFISELSVSNLWAYITW